MKPPKRPPSNVTIGNRSIETHYKNDNQTVDLEVITIYNRDGSIKSKSVHNNTGNQEGRRDFLNRLGLSFANEAIGILLGATAYQQFGASIVLILIALSLIAFLLFMWLSLEK